MQTTSGKKNKLWLIALVVLVLLALYFISAQRKLISGDETVTKTWNNLQSDYQRRYDLIPNLVGSVKASGDYEKATLTKLIEARAKASQLNLNGGATFENYQKSEATNAEVVVNANKVIGVIEKYPDLKTTNAFVRLQDQLIGTERRIKFSRKDFNNAVKNYNTYVRSFPSSIAASLFGFKVKEGFTADVGTDKAPEINFSK